MNIKCQRCKYEWYYNGSKKKQPWSQYTSCPKCYTQVKIDFNNVKGGRKNGKNKN